MSWIRRISPEQAEGKLARIYQQVAGADGQVDNILSAHSLRPHSLVGHMALYKNVLHHSANTLPKFLLESLGVLVSQLNQCAYCVSHHAEGLKKNLQDHVRANALLSALESGNWADGFTPAQCLLLEYAHKLTTAPSEIDKNLIEQLRKVGYSDGEILEANQVIAYFAYANRTVLGLGVNIDGEELGLSPNSNDEENWSHR